MPGSAYRMTAVDTGDGSVVKRYTWWGRNASRVHNKRLADKDYSYEMRRVMDADGKVNRKVLAEMQRVYGSHVYVRY